MEYISECFELKLKEVEKCLECDGEREEVKNVYSFILNEDEWQSLTKFGSFRMISSMHCENCQRKTYACRNKIVLKEPMIIIFNVKFDRLKK